MDMRVTNLNHNAVILWKFPNGPIIARGDELKVVGPRCCPLLGRITFWIKDWWSKGEENRKVHELVLKTFNKMQLQMTNKGSHWHFADSFQTIKGPITLCYTYEMLAEKILQKSSLTKIEEISREAQKLKETFNKIDFTQGVEGVCKEDVIFYMIGGSLFLFEGIPSRPSDGPSVHPKELEALAKEKKEYGLSDKTPEELQQVIQITINRKP